MWRALQFVVLCLLAVAVPMQATASLTLFRCTEARTSGAAALELHAHADHHHEVAAPAAVPKGAHRAAATAAKPSGVAKAKCNACAASLLAALPTAVARAHASPDCADRLPRAAAQADAVFLTGGVDRPPSFALA